MKILDLILARKTVHNYSPAEVPKSVIQNAILAAIHAPNHKKNWPWRFYIVGQKSRKKLAELNVQLKEKKSDSQLSDIAKAATISQFMDPSVLIMACIKRSEDPVRAREDYASLACALQNMALYFESEGFGSKWGTGPVMSNDKTYEILGIDKNDLEICGLFWAGKEKTPTARVERPPVAEFYKIIE